MRIRAGVVGSSFDLPQGHPERDRDLGAIAVFVVLLLPLSHRVKRV